MHLGTSSIPFIEFVFVQAVTNLLLMPYFRALVPHPARYSNSVRVSQSLPSRRVRSYRAADTQHLTSQSRSMSVQSPKMMRYRIPHSNNVEDVEKYRKGGLHPIHLGDALKGGRYCILHKFGYGGFSTVWLARDKLRDRLVSLKVLTAEASHQPKDLRLFRHLEEHVQADPWRGNIIAHMDDFTIEGPNGTHLCYVSQPGGPSVSTISDSPGEVAGTRRLRAALARKVAQQLAMAVSIMHGVGVVHGGALNTGS